ncbi:MAG TPA: hypothetical protein VGR28_12545 [Candidatus Thermoplasmatota archaeon]|jgi:hypothetical protein|nr:hypothetical protein [Candidatus Thermoplasmatota archaeon]
MATPAPPAKPAPILDKTWQVGLGWGIVLTALTVGGVWLAARSGSTAPIGLGVLGWILFVLWLEKGVPK